MAPQEQNTTPTHPYRVLVVDDNELLLSCMKRYLTRNFQSVDAVCLGEEALISLQRGSYDMAVLDINLPGADGWEVLEKIRRDSPETRVVMITSRGGRDVKRTALGNGAVAFLEKPFSLRKLEDVLVRLPSFRKRDERVCKSLEVRIEEGQSGVTRNLSMTGMFVETEANFSPRGDIGLALLTTGGDPIDLKGRVVRTEESERSAHHVKPGDGRPQAALPRGLGIELINPPPAYSTLVSSLLAG